MSGESCDDFGVFPGQILEVRSENFSWLYKVIGVDEKNELVLVNVEDNKPKFFNKSVFRDRIEKGSIRHLSGEEEKELRKKLGLEIGSVAEEKEGEESTQKDSVQKEKTEGEKLEPKKDKFTASKEGSYAPQIQEKLEKMEEELKINPENPNLVLSYAIALSKITGKEKLAGKFFEEARKIVYKKEYQNKETEAKILQEYVKFLKSRRYFLHLIKKQGEGEHVTIIRMHEERGTFGTESTPYRAGIGIRGSEQESRKILHYAAQIQPEDMNILADLIDAYTDIKEFNYAKDLLDVHLDKHPNDPNLFSSYGKLKEKEGKQDEARKYFQKSLEIDSSNLRHTLDFANFSFKRGHIKEARKMFEDTLKFDPENSDVIYNLAQLYERLHDYKTAIEYIEKLLSLDPENSDAFILKAVLDYKAGNTMKAEEEFKEVLEKHSYNIYSWISYVKIQLKQGNFEKAENLISSFIYTVPIDIQNSRALRNLRAELRAAKNSYKEPARWKSNFKEEEEYEKNDIISYNVWAGIELKAGKIEKAEELFKKALELDSENAYTLRNYGKMLVNVEGRKEEGKSYISKAREFGLE